MQAAARGVARDRKQDESQMKGEGQVFGECKKRAEEEGGGANSDNVEAVNCLLLQGFSSLLSFRRPVSRFLGVQLSCIVSPSCCVYFPDHFGLTCTSLLPARVSSVDASMRVFQILVS